VRGSRFDGQFSVIIPTYNGIAFLSQAVHSVWAQTCAPRELIVVDDASTDGTRALAASLSRESPFQMRVIALKENSGGPARPINEGFNAAQGDYLAVLDQDDCFHHERLRLHGKAFAECPDASVTFGFSANISTPTLPIQAEDLRAAIAACSRATESGQVRELPGDLALKLLCLKGNFATGFPGFSIRRSRLAGKQVDESFGIAADYELLCHLAKAGSFACHTSVGYYRREHEANLTRRTMNMYLEMARVRERQLVGNELRNDGDIRTELQSWFEMMAYWVREAGHPIASIRLYRTLGRVWGWNVRWLLSLIKVVPVCVFRRVTLQKPRLRSITTDR
jgi:glycosyltransferase involved in cell wall biosynthesis